MKTSFPHNYLFQEAMIDVPCKSDPCFGGSGWCARRIIIAYSRTYNSLLYGAQHDVMKGRVKELISLQHVLFTISVLCTLFKCNRLRSVWREDYLSTLIIITVLQSRSVIDW